MDLPITIKELFPIVLAVDIWSPLLANHKILFLTDNAALADIINKTSSKEKNIMKLVRRLVLSSLKHNIHVRARHIPGKTNLICDLLSRFFFSGSSSDSSMAQPDSCGHSTSIFDTVTDQLVNASLSTSTILSYNRMLNVYKSFCKRFFPCTDKFHVPTP